MQSSTMHPRPAIDSTVEHQTRAFLEALAAAGGKPMEELSPDEAREVLVGAQSSSKVALPPADVSRKRISAAGGEVELTIVRPAGSTEVLPGFMFFHGGGWVIGDFPTHERFIRDLVIESGAAAIYVDYTRSPEAKYPTAIEQAFDATQWVVDHGAEINIDGSRLAVVGNSAGGNLAIAVSLYAKERGLKLAYQVLFWPVTDANFETGSYNHFAENHFLTKNMMCWFWDHYTSDDVQRQEIYASPLQASIEQLQGLPPTLIQTAGCDVLRDEGNAFGHKLDEAGVEVTITQYNGMIHDFGLLNALSELPGTRSALLQAGAELKRRLAK